MPSLDNLLAESSLDAFQVLVAPGRSNSGAHHWQTFLEAALIDAQRVIQADWNRPRLGPWARRVAESVARSEKPVLVVAHSFGCLATVAAGGTLAAPIAGALLVAPADPGRFGIDQASIDKRLPFPSTLVLSRNDPWLDLEVGRALGARWGSRIVDAGMAGHINVDSGHGVWPLAAALLKDLAAAVGALPAVIRPLRDADPFSWQTAPPLSRARSGTRRASHRRG